MSESVADLRAQLRQLEALHAAGALDDAAHGQEKASLERRLVDAVLAAEPAAASKPGALSKTVRPSRGLVASLSAFVVALAVGGYAWTGTPRALDPAVRAPIAADAGVDADEAPPAQIGAKEIAQMVDRLAERLKERPDDGEGWTMLARSYAVLGRRDEALPAYEKAVALRGDDAALLADLADLLASQNGRATPRSEALIAKALTIDPNNVKALALDGAAAYDRGDFAGAAARWEKAAATLPEDDPFATQLRAGIADARGHDGAPAAAAATDSATPAPAAARASDRVPQGDARSANAAVSGAAGASAAAAPAPPSNIVAGGPALTGSVSLRSSLAAQVSPDDIVFVSARAANGPRMPLAAMRARVRDLPLAFRLDDSMAMNPAAKLSGAASVIVTARISRSGDAIPHDGDLAGESAAVEPGAAGIAVQIDHVLKR